MPWKVIKRDCKQSDGKSGRYVVLKVKGGGGTEQSSCHTSKEKAQGSVGARKMNEGRKIRITKRQLRRLIREAYTDPYGYTHPHKLSGGDAPDLKHLENILHGIEWGDFYEDPMSYMFKNAKDARDKAQKISKQLADEGQAEDVLAAWKKYAIGAENFIEKLEYFIKNNNWPQ